MKLTHVFDIDLGYTSPFRLVQPFGTEEGWGYGEGEGTVRTVIGEHPVEGTARWFNRPQRRSDAAMLPDLAGHIEMADGAELLFRFGGRTVAAGGGPASRQLLWVEFLSEAEEYRWLNDALCVLEGVIDPERLVMRSHVYVCENELG